MTRDQWHGKHDQTHVIEVPAHVSRVTKKGFPKRHIAMDDRSTDNEAPKTEDAPEGAHPAADEPFPAASGDEELLVAGVQHRTAGNIYTFAAHDEGLAVGDKVVIEGEHGESVGLIVVPPHRMPKSSVPTNIRNIVRRANDEDIRLHHERLELAQESFEICARKIKDHGLAMKLIDAEVAEGGKKIIFSFFAEQRVDFRGLVKDMASHLHKYIELRQVGSRDASSLVGCMGPCGRMTCCSSYLRQFQSISIAMAKNQGLSPNPAKLTGMCNKLKCCLAYENRAYVDLKKDLPRHNSWVETPRGVGRITKLDILRRICSVKLETGGEARFPCGECHSTDARPMEHKRPPKQGGGRTGRRERLPAEASSTQAAAEEESKDDDES